MSDMMDRLHEGGNVEAPIAVFYGRPGIGKTTLAAQAPGPIFLETERGLTNPELNNVQTFGLLPSFDDFMAAFKAVYEHHEKQGWKTLVIDSIDRLNPLIDRHVCKVNRWSSLEEGAYGKGKNLFREEWQKLLTKLIRLRDETSMNVVMLGHHAMTKVTPPDADSYTQYTLTLDEKVRQLVVADSDIVGFCTYPTHTISRDEGFGKKSGRAVTQAPVIQLKETGAAVAKNRYNMPETVKMTWPDLAKYVDSFRGE